MKNNKLATLYDRACLIALAIALFAALFSTIPYELVLGCLPQDSIFRYGCITFIQVLAIALLVKYAKLHPCQKGGLLTIGFIASFAVIVYLFYKGSTGNISPNLIKAIYSGIGGLIIAAAVLGVRYWLLKERIKLETHITDQDKIRSWLNSSEEYPLDLVKGREDQAKRLSNFLASEQCHRGIVVYGKYGEGKTTLVETIKNYMPSKSWNIVHFSAWGKESLIPMILKDIVSTLSKRFETHQVEMLPNSLVKELGGVLPAQGMTDYLLNQLQPSYGHVELVERLNDLLIKADQRCLVIIEDIDRGDHVTSNLNALGALFDLLTKHDRIKFIFTLKEKEEYNVPLTKILDKPEELQTLDPLIAILTFIDLCRKEALEEGYILTDTKFGDALYLMAGESLSSLDEKFARYIYGDIAKVLTNPRDLRQSLRAAWQLWHLVKGEVNIDDVLAFSIVYKSSININAKDIVNNWQTIYKKYDSKEGMSKILSKELGEGDLIIKIVGYLLRKDSVGGKYQSINLSEDLYSETYLNILRDQRPDRDAIISQARLKKLQAVWKNDWKPDQNIVKELFNDYRKYIYCIEAFSFSQDPSNYLLNHANILASVLKYSADSCTNIHMLTQLEYDERVIPIKRYFEVISYRSEECSVNWINDLDLLALENQNYRWIVISVYLLLVEPNNNHTSPTVRKYLSTSLNKLLSDIDFQYVERLPKQHKWRTIKKYNPNWSASKEIRSLIGGDVNQLWVESINLLAHHILLESLDIEWQSKVSVMLGLTKADMENWVAKLRATRKVVVDLREAPQPIIDTIESILVKYSDENPRDTNHVNKRLNEMMESVVLPLEKESYISD